MAKKAISVTLDLENLTWLRARAGAGGVRSVSEFLDRIVTKARTAGDAVAPRSVVGTIDIDSSDPLLERADDGVRSLFEVSVGRPLRIREAPPAPGAARRKRKQGRG